MTKKKFIIDSFEKYRIEKVEKENELDLKEMAHFYGGWKELKDVINRLEENDNEDAGERSMNENDAWDGGFADNH